MTQMMMWLWIWSSSVPSFRALRSYELNDPGLVRGFLMFLELEFHMVDWNSMALVANWFSVGFS